MFVIVLYVSSYRWVHFSRAVLWCYQKLKKLSVLKTTTTWITKMADCNIMVVWCELYYVWLRNSTHEVKVENRQVILWTGRTSFLLLLNGFSFHTFSREFCQFVFRRNIQRFSFQQVSGIQWFDFQKMKLTHSLSLSLHIVFTPHVHIMCLNVCNCFKERLPDMHSCLNLYPYVSIPPPPTPLSLSE